MTKQAAIRREFPLRSIAPRGPALPASKMDFRSGALAAADALPRCQTAVAATIRFLRRALRVCPSPARIEAAQGLRQRALPHLAGKSRQTNSRIASCPYATQKTHRMRGCRGTAG